MTYIKPAALILVGTLGLSGCVGGLEGLTLPGLKSAADSESDDSKKTKTQGVLAGAAVGFLAGMLAGDDWKKGLIGAAVGAGAGYLVANEIAKRKSAYKNTEELIDKESQRTAELLKEAKSINNSLRNDIKTYQHESKQLQVQVAKGKADKNSLQAQKKVIEQRYEDSKKALDAVDKELQVAEELYSDSTGEKKSAAALKQWQHRIGELKTEKLALQKHSGQLQAISKTLG